MQDNVNIIHTLSSETINQIAAGEVVQRPSSVVKELMENAIDAGADKIDVIIQDAGRTLVQVIDNGKGMSAQDSVKAFERHATSKINGASDLYALTTMGFRGEALASIAAVSRVELKTRRKDDELGSRVEINGGELALQEFISCSEGTQILVKDLFYNIPVRRKFLKKNETELRSILNVFQQIALVYPSIRFTLSHNGSMLFSLEKENYRQRISSVCGAKTGKELLPINVDTVLARISGFISTPESAVKKQPSQYFFVNGRYIQHPYFAKAVQLGYDKILPSDVKPQFFIYFDVDPDKID
ncbi:MAG: DNA mismatch repair endonuclease MutL, partial [Paludibacteraceae bacterium]|nr:DNA mismatch repair endonuclease MutL [Paludibacteraceae bacterium]